MDTARIYNKSMWKRGEWDSEPDRVDFIHAGFSCLLLRNMLGNWCGYVGVPSTHPLYKVEYNDYDNDAMQSLDVHGGLTYSDVCHGNICHEPNPDMPEDVWWLGFDTAHHMDVSPSMETLEIEHATYKNTAYVRVETEKLAEQLAEVK